MSDDRVTAIRLAQAAQVGPDLCELKRCGWATSNGAGHRGHAPCELQMGHPASQRCESHEGERERNRAVAEIIKHIDEQRKKTKRRKKP